MSGWNSGPTQVDQWSGNQPSWESGGGGNSHYADAEANDQAASYGGNDASYGGNDGYDNAGRNDGPRDDKCFTCGESGHRKAECPNKPAVICGNCGQEGHMKRECVNARKIDRSGIAEMEVEAAWQMIKTAAAEQDADDAKDGIQAYVKAVGGDVTFRQLQQALINEQVNLWLIATERSLIEIFTNMDLQGNMGKKYTVTYRFSDKPQRPREIDGWPKSVEEILSRLDDAGDVVDSGKPKCSNCDEVGHMARECSQEKVVREVKGQTCYNCGGDGHRMRACPEPRKDRFACRNCGKSGHKASECEEEPNLDNVTCRKCDQTGHFAKDCPQGGGRGCRNCGQEGHFAADCDQPPNMDNVQCRNCEKMGHFSRECPEPKDWSKVKCSNCNNFGHTKVRCKEPPADEADGNYGGGFDSQPANEPASNGNGGGDDWNSGGASQSYGGGGGDAW